MQMYYGYKDPKTKEEVIIEFTLKTEPPEGAYWSTYKLQKSDIVILTPMDRSEKAKMREAILNDIFLTEPNLRTTKKKINSRLL
tara:strand:+ start:1014 stop:1265 length:252 start_codon:yes stop_codon:yes gene_type:complete